MNLYFFKKEYTPLVKYDILYTTLVPLSGSPCLNYIIILTTQLLYIPCWLYKSSPRDAYLHLGDISYLSYSFTYVSSLSILGYIYFLVIHPLPYTSSAFNSPHVCSLCNLIHTPLSTNGRAQGEQPYGYHLVPFHFLQSSV